jgi:uncharacterized protein HemX
MIKKLVVVGIVVAVVILVTGLGGHLITSVRMAKERAAENIPMTYQIERARDEIAQLQPDIEKNMYAIASEEAQLQRLDRQIVSLEEELTGDRDELLRLTTDLESGEEVFQYAGNVYTEEQVRTDVTNRFDRYQTNDETLISLREVRQARVASLGAAREKLNAVQNQKRQLEVQIENLQARLQMVEAAQAVNGVHIDDGQLSEAQQMVEDIEMRIQVRERLANSGTQDPGEIPLESEASEDIVEEVVAYFGTDAPTVEAIALSE